MSNVIINSSKPPFHTKLPRGQKRYVISTVVPGFELNELLLAGLEYYCERNDAELILLPTKKFTRHGDIDGEVIEYVRSGNSASDKFISLNKNLKILNDPQTAGADRIKAKNGRLGTMSESIIMSGTNQNMIPLPRPGDEPRHVYGTGCICFPGYLDKSNATAVLYTEKHVNGAIVVETDGDYSYVRQMKWSTHGLSFIDLNTMYYYCPSSKKIKEKKILGEDVMITPGDSHAAQLDPEIFKLHQKFCKLFPGDVKHFCLHDVFDGGESNYSHHGAMDIILQTKRGKKKNNNLLKELKTTRKVIENYEKLCDEVLIVKSNHDEILDRNVSEQRFIKTMDWTNYELFAILSLAKLYNMDLLEFALNYLETFQRGLERYFGSLGGNKINLRIPTKKILKKTTFLGRTEPVIVWDILVSIHGDGGFGRFYKADTLGVKCNTGHSHSSMIDDVSFRAGVSTGYRHGYNRDAVSNWDRSWICTIRQYEKQTHRQIVIVANNGKFCLSDLLNN